MLIFASKIGTTHIWDDKGRQQVATILKLQNSTVGKIKTADKDGYQALVMVKSEEKAKPNKVVAGQFKNLTPDKITEERVEGEISVKVGDSFNASNFTAGELISIIGTSKGKGFQGTVKRHGFNTGPKTHGSRNYRRPGSIGMTTPSRVTKGRQMAGHMGANKITMKKAQVLESMPKENLLVIKGHVVGPSKGNLIIIK